MGRSLWLLATLMVGAYIFLVGQIYNLSLTFWQAPLLWMLAALAMAYALQSKAHAWLAIPLGLLALAGHYRFEPRPVAVARGNEKDWAAYCTS